MRPARSFVKLVTLLIVFLFSVRRKMLIVFNQVTKGPQGGCCRFGEGRREAGIRPPVVHRQGVKKCCCLLAGCEENEVAQQRSKRGATRGNARKAGKTAHAFIGGSQMRSTGQSNG